MKIAVLSCGRQVLLADQCPGKLFLGGLVFSTIGYLGATLNGSASRVLFPGLRPFSPITLAKKSGI